MQRTHFRSLNSWSESKKAYENAIAIDPIVFAELNIELFEMYLLEKRDTDTAAYALANKIITDRGPEDPELLTWFAEFIATDDRLSDNTRRMDVAMNAAQTALTFAKRKTDPLHIYQRLPWFTLAMEILMKRSSGKGMHISLQGKKTNRSTNLLLIVTKCKSNTLQLGNTNAR